MGNVMKTTELKSGINEFCEMANMLGVGECELFPCSLSRKSADFWILKRGKPIPSAQKRWVKGDVAFCMRN
ncbi:hypothetical protein T10_5999 [Trichinella papuae]|uniref:Uncharacterized protein n=1 Tax=Trichinella papuae TaxID=268474 RepID=A0A0V1MPA1_9BILA|nr:hypothetical protein T10_5999 [Trichinella papuae]